MDIEKQVCTLEQARKLNELGVTQDSYLSWYSLTGDEPFLIDTEDLVGDWHADHFSAFTVAELGVMLGDFISEVNIWDSTQTEAWHRAEILIDHLTEKPQHTQVRLKMVNERLSS